MKGVYYINSVQPPQSSSTFALAVSLVLNLYSVVHLKFAHAFAPCASLGIRSNQGLTLLGTVWLRFATRFNRPGRPRIRRWSEQDHRQGDMH